MISRRHALGRWFDGLGFRLLDLLYRRYPVTYLQDRTLLCSFEGICGSGKTTQISSVTNVLTQAGVTVGQFHIPAYDVTCISRVLKKFYRHRGCFQYLHRYFPTLNLFLILLDFWELTRRRDKQCQLDHCPEVILFSRGLLSTYVYNAPILARSYDSSTAAIECIRKYGSLFWRPDVIFFFDIAPEKAYERICLTRTTRRYQETPEGLKSSYEMFRTMIDLEIPSGTLLVRVDATRPIEHITRLLLATMHQAATAHCKGRLLATLPEILQRDAHDT